LPGIDTISARRVPLPVIPDMVERLGELIGQIPSGRITTPGRLAKGLGDAAAARWVGHYLLHHDHSPQCACHRVVRADGQLGQYIRGDGDHKRRQLVNEGISTSAGRVDVARFALDEFVSDRPLDALRAWQQRVAESVSIMPTRGMPTKGMPTNDRPTLLAAVDVSYGRPNEATAAYVLFDLANREQIWSHTITRDVAFPYISSYLAFRELPVYVELLDDVRSLGRLANVVLVDGSGILHPRCAGSASCLGVVADVPTVGVTKRLLCGRLEHAELPPGGSCRIAMDESILGAALRSSPRSKKPIYISPGHRIDVATALDLVQSTLSTRRLPDPLYWADRLSREAAQSAIS